MTLQDYIRVLRKGWVLIVVGLLLGIALGSALAIIATPKYQSQTKIFVSVQTTDSTSTGELVQGNSYAQQKVQSYLAVVTSPSVLDPVIDELGLDTTAASLENQISASSTTGTVIISITATDPDPQQAANIANATANSFQNVVVDELERPSDGGPSLVKVQTIQPAEPSSQPSSPNLALNIGIGAVLGLIIGVGGAVLRSTLDTRVHGRHDIEALTDVPILGGTTYDAESTKHPLIVHTDPRNPRAESFRGLRTNLRFVNVDQDNRAFVVTSSIPGEGKSTTTANLALALAETGARVVLVDADLRLPKLAEYMGLEGAVGLTDVLIGRAALADVLQRWGNKDLFVLPAGQVPPNPSELLGSEAMVGLLAALNEQVDYVLLDSPPLLPVTDAAVLSNLTAGAIVVAAAGKVKKTEVVGAIRNLNQTNSKVIGIVLTMLPSKGPDAYGGTEYSYYGGSHEPAEVMPKSRPRRGRK
ncbi:polysaccharide biosynthesis tyrosine autokinase [Herbiconiux sp. KACC 21604]|uniref:polysaccharide biosynthesis tyrosine autokinase n=1 Tax=unclassified Herbiconiux TaxID=2618217 RepID=UPI001492D887|nr:polysaccharide biosynthesis tyrosine autokinase [Herbiconiux sp. SALV-R1]QJU54587.1 polysaccharide biosynthesis tyrosine autokinase [Herbiconiux sp. SALV-R1]WPO85673.1 polysaccharide biosynthesis tyrosine autokinase [Herbiconiux sp. KACC 21604]